MTWRKLGRVYVPSDPNWTHASTPTAYKLGGGYWRIFFAQRDKQQRGHIFSLDLDIRNPAKPMNVQGPLVNPGRKGSFYDCGLSPCCVYQEHLYFLGWHRSMTAPFNNWLGRSRIFDGRLTVPSEAPLFCRTMADPLSVSYCWIADGGLMYYATQREWGETDQDMRYDLVHGPLDNPITVLSPQGAETAIGRPTIIGNKMWFSVKRNDIGYRIGYADKLVTGPWERDDALAGIDVSDSGWDSEAVTYPCVFEDLCERYMLYNGNRYGKTGFGIAIYE